MRATGFTQLGILSSMPSIILFVNATVGDIAAECLVCANISDRLLPRNFIKTDDT